MGHTITLEQIINFLLEAPMFGDLDAAELSKIVHIMQIQRLREGQFVFREGQPGDAWFVLYEGEVEVSKDTGFDNSVIAVLEPPACFGEMAILDGSPRSATIRAVGDATAFRFTRAQFNELLESDNLAAYKLVYQMARVLVERQRSTTTALAEMLAEHGASVKPRLSPILTESSVAE